MKLELSRKTLGCMLVLMLVTPGGSDQARADEPESDTAAPALAPVGEAEWVEAPFAPLGGSNGGTTSAASFNVRPIVNVKTRSTGITFSLRW